MLRAGFAEVDITPPLGTDKIGCLRRITPTVVEDPLSARAMVLESGGQRVAMLALDTLSIRWTTTQAIRRRAQAECGIAADNLLVGATHNHGGPPVAETGDVERDDEYLETLVDRCAKVLRQACEALTPAKLGFGKSCEFNVGFNRRVILRNGLVRTHGRFHQADAVCLEGPIDPRVEVIVLRTLDDKPLGLTVNFACHPAHHCSDDIFSGGWPALMAANMKQRGWPACVYLQGAAGEIATSDPSRDGAGATKQEVAARMADAVDRAMQSLAWHDDVILSASRTSLDLPYRDPTPEQVAGTVPGAQRFIDPAIYDRAMDRLIKRIRTRKVQPAEVQTIRIADHVLVTSPSELFCHLGLRIKLQTYPWHTLVVAYANGMVGYLPHAEAMDRGGYETTFALSSRMARNAGELMADAMVQQVRTLGKPPIA